MIKFIAFYFRCANKSAAFIINRNIQFLQTIHCITGRYVDVNIIFDGPCILQPNISLSSFSIRFVPV